MKILLLGSGGREHALAHKMIQSPHCDALFIAPGNAGTGKIGANVPISITDFDAQKDFCIDNAIDLVVVGPEEPLVKGIYNYYKADAALQHIIVVGPSAEAAQLEGSKAFSKQFMLRHGIPTAGYASFTIDTLEAGKKYLANHTLPIVLKADGLAAGKGVIICQDHSSALVTFENMLLHDQFGEAGNTVVVEEFLTGIEVSVFVLTNGTDYQIIGHAKDYKRIGEGDTGLNTGGMGCVSPVPFVDDAFITLVDDTIIRPTITGIQQEGLIYNGFIFFGLMVHNHKPYLIEYNCRMGDPETEVVLPRLETDIVALFAAMDNGTLADANIFYDERSCATVVAVSGGYPGHYQKLLPVTGLDQSPANKETYIYHAGTTLTEPDTISTNGGRVLAVTSFGETIHDAVQKSLSTLETIHFDGIYYRKDIGFEFQ